MPTIFMTQTFSHQVEKLDGTTKSRVLAFMAKVQDGTTGGLNIKPIKGAIDPRIRVGRINLNYRAVMIQAGEGVYALLAVDTHDEAYKYAERITVGVNRATGALDVVDTHAIEAARELAGQQVYEAPPTQSDPTAPRGAQGPSGASGQEGSRPDSDPSGAAPSRLKGWQASTLVALGVQEDMAQAIVSADLAEAVECIAELLPLTQGIVVLDLLAGKDIEAVRQEYLPEEAIDSEDLEEAMRRPISQITFVDAKDAVAVQAAFEDSLAAWRVWLHPTQTALAHHLGWNGPYRVTGGAGTGKTVTAVHRARFLHKHRCSTPSRARPGGLLPAVVLLTYTKNLATAIGAQLNALAGERLAGDGVEVANIDALARRIVLLTAQGEEWLAGRRPLSSLEQRHYISSAAEMVSGLPEGLDLAEEIEGVILTGAVKSKEDYFATPRIGRGTRLSRRQRLSVWKAYERLIIDLDQDQRFLWSQVPHQAALILSEDAELVERLGVRHLIVDEAQDLSAAHWRFLRALVPEGKDDLFIVGDAHQRIYGRPVPLSRFGIQTRGRSRRLTVNYRTSKQILQWSLGVADADADDLDEQPDTLAGARSVFSGPPVDVPGHGLPKDPDRALEVWLRSLVPAEDRQDESDPISEPSQARHWQWQEIAVVRFRREDVARTLAHLAEAGIPAVEVASATNEETLPDAIRVMTMHRAKGLEYRAVAVRDASSMCHREDRLGLNLVYVAATRARERLLVC